MSRLIKTRIILPHGTPEELSAKYEGKELSAGELLIVTNDDGSFTLSTGSLQNNTLFSAGAESDELSSRKGRLMIDAECVKLSNDISGQPVTLTQQLCTVVNNLSVLSVVTVGTPPEEVSAAVGSLQWKINELSSKITSLSSAITQLNTNFNQRTETLSNNLIHALSICDANSHDIAKLNTDLSANMINLSNVISGKYATKQYVDQQIANALSGQNGLSA